MHEGARGTSNPKFSLTIKLKIRLPRLKCDCMGDWKRAVGC